MGEIVEFNHEVIMADEKTDQDWIAAGRVIRQEAEANASNSFRALGVWYAGVQDSRKTTQVVFSAQEICEQAGYENTQPANAAKFIRVFPTVESQQGLNMTFCRGLLPAHRILGHEEFHNQQHGFVVCARNGTAYREDPEQDYIYTGPWSEEDRVRQVSLVKDNMLPAPRSTELTARAKTVTANTEASVKGLKLPKKQEKQILAIMKKQVASEIRDLHRDFQSKVEAAAEEKFKAELAPRQADAEAHVKLGKEYKEKYLKMEVQIKARLRGVKAFMTKNEYKLVIGCLHPDRAPEGQEEKFGKAFTIVKRLEPGVDMK